MQLQNLINAPASNDWQVLQSVFPPDWKELAKTTKALRQLRKNKSPEDLLRILLIHIGCGYSLRETVARARLAGLMELSDVGLLKRLRKSGPWLHALAQKMLFTENRPVPDTHNKIIRIFDASIIREPGKSGSQWRLHFGLQLPGVGCDFFEITPSKGDGTGESFTRFPINKNDYVIADRGYCSTAGIFYVVKKCKAHVLVRNISNRAYLNPEGGQFDTLRHLRTLKTAGAIGSWPVCLQNEAGKIVTGRLCAVRKTKDAIVQSQKSVCEIARKKQKKLARDTLEHAKYVVVFTTFPENEFNTNEILEWYRVRWQVELVFKRFKSIAEVGHLPKHDPESSKAWLYGKLFFALAIERVMHLASNFSP